MTEVHPSAIVHHAVELGEDVVIGPYAIVEKNVKIDNGTSIGAHVVIRANTSIGKNNKIYQFSSIGEEPQHQGYKNEPTAVDIGDNNVMREYCSINRGTIGDKGVTRIGSHNFFMACTHIAHDSVVGDHTILANASGVAGHAVIGDYAILGAYTIAHQFCKIGQHCITGMGSVCLQDVPPYIIASGNPIKPYGINVKGLNKRGFSEQTIRSLKESYKILYRQQKTLKKAVETITDCYQDPHVLQFIEFINNSGRGIIR